MARTTKFPVTMRALTQRINRALRDKEQVLQFTRGARARSGEYGDYYLIDRRRNVVVNKDVDPEEYGRELGVLAPYEEVRGD